VSVLMEKIDSGSLRDIIHQVLISCLKSQWHSIASAFSHRVFVKSGYNNVNWHNSHNGYFAYFYFDVMN